MSQISKKIDNRSTVMRMCHFWTQNGSISPNKIFSENLLINLVPIIHLYLRSKNQRYQSIHEILTTKEYWNLIHQEPVLAITWEPDFSQTRRFHRILKDSKTFRFTSIPDRANDLIFPKRPKNLVFWPFLTPFFQKFLLCHI